jgi:hypothetical protein
MRDDGGTGPLTHVSGRMGAKDPAIIARLAS